jgi:hypothetical protein
MSALAALAVQRVGYGEDLDILAFAFGALHSSISLLRGKGEYPVL